MCLKGEKKFRLLVDQQADKVTSKLCFLTINEAAHFYGYGKTIYYKFNLHKRAFSSSNATI